MAAELTPAQRQQELDLAAGLLDSDPRVTLVRDAQGNIVGRVMSEPMPRRLAEWWRRNAN